MDEQRQWWEELFQIYEYRQFAGAAQELTRGEVDFLMQALALAPGMALLDVACGNGRHVLELARRDVQAEGLELAAAVVAHAEETAAQERLPAHFHRRDMRDLEGLGPYDAVLIMNSSFGFFSDEENAALLRQAAEVLAPGGRLLLQCINPYQIVSYLAGYRTGWHRVGAGYVLRQARFDPQDAALLADYVYLDPASATERRHPGERIRLYTYRELTALLRGAGLRPIMAFGDAALPPQPFEESSLWQVLVAEREGLSTDDPLARVP